MGSMKSMTGKVNMAAYGYENEKVDVEGLLNGIRPLCSNKEREIVDKILNIFNAKRMFEMYNNFMSMMKTMQEFGGFPFGDTGTGNNTDNVMGNFAGFNFDSIFGNNAAKTSADHASEEDYVSEADYVSEVNHASDADHASEEDHEYDQFSSFNQNENSSSNDGATEQAPHSRGTSNNNMMLDMLKAMVPPEQMSTFENLSMLLNTMSYDNSSKPSDSEERNNG
jgi:hypothetical protein